MNIKRLLLTSLLFTFLAACNTVHGVGQDLQAGGGAISKAAASA